MSVREGKRVGLGGGGLTNHLLFSVEAREEDFRRKVLSPSNFPWKLCLSLKFVFGNENYPCSRAGYKKNFTKHCIFFFMSIP